MSDNDSVKHAESLGRLRNKWFQGKIKHWSLRTLLVKLIKIGA